ncbi:hypothetical protein F0L74_02030 [Chitinophaga agrisoli]|uniref:LTD domain-containing protein n=1 Tax=Chitinophaga agrisoli TaxID=2607653 RepID=A0A5B2W2P7_9BACT|nr:lamin tail domain-containing protein [Chitinophaga agrisoli]KAA2244776.1 hypothetical protein F0L74_02030 [Chitinophaga agrisoli]
MRTPVIGGVALLMLLFSTLSHAQIHEFFNGPSVPWHGTDTAWQVNEARLQSNWLQPDSYFGLYAPANIPAPAIWEWWMQLDLNTSSNNYADVFLQADSSQLLHPATAGYFVRIGGKDDEICLYRKTPYHEPYKIIDGRDGLTNKRAVTLKLKVTCDEMDTWHLWIDTSGTGRNYFLQGSITDSQVHAPVCFGVLIRQSTASFFQKHFFDDIQVIPLVKDTTAPQLLAVKVLNARELLLQFSEWVDTTAARYIADNNIGAPAAVIQQADGIHLYYDQPFPDGDSVRLTINGITDAGGNIAQTIRVSFLYYLPGRYQVLIHEIFSDPEPSVGLPPAEFIELRNVSPHDIQLQGWRLAATGGATVLPVYTLQPDSLVLLCRTDKTSLFSQQNLLPLDKFPTLGNETDTLALYEADGRLMHAVAYHRNWYADAIKEKGGWSLEMISPAAPCNGQANWKPSTAPTGGTPGASNSVASSTTDNTFIDLQRAYVPDRHTILLYFNKTLDSMLAANVAAYHIIPALTVAAATVMPPLFNTVQLHLASPLQHATIYAITASNITDCTGQPAGLHNSVTAGLPTTPDSSTVIINELLFDPLQGAPEFVEIYNNGNAVIDLSGLYISMLGDDGRPENPVPLSTDGRLLLPGQYLALTRDPDALCRYYTCKAAENLLQVNNLPLLPNEGGTLALYNVAGQEVDALPYSPDMQLPLAGNTKGVSLERLSTGLATADVHNWYPAAITAGYATPGIANSQQLGLPELAGEVTVVPSVFSPDLDGMDDLAVISCNIREPGVANITIFDSQGRPVRQLLQNGVLGNRNHIIWDGLDEKKQSLAAGIYIIFMEMFDNQGRLKHWKLPVVLAKRLK